MATTKTKIIQIEEYEGKHIPSILKLADKILGTLQQNQVKLPKNLTELGLSSNSAN